jgi:hypothetical protein
VCGSVIIMSVKPIIVSPPINAVSPGAREKIARAAGGVWNNHAYRFCRIGLLGAHATGAQQ